MITITTFLRRFVPFAMGAILFGWGALVPFFASWNPAERVVGNVHIIGVPFVPNTFLSGMHFGSWSFGFAWWDDLFVLITGCYLLATAIVGLGRIRHKDV